MKKLILMFLVCCTPLMGKTYEILRSDCYSYESIETFVKDLKKDSKNKNIKIEQRGATELFDVKWIETIELDI